MLNKKEVPLEIVQKHKDLLTTTLIFTLLLEDYDIIVYYDASHLSLFVGLIHEKDAIDCDSKKLKVHERNYPTHELELVAVVFSLKN